MDYKIKTAIANIPQYVIPSATEESVYDRQHGKTGKDHI